MKCYFLGDILKLRKAFINLYKKKTKEPIFNIRIKLSRIFKIENSGFFFCKCKCECIVIWFSLSQLIEIIILMQQFKAFFTTV